MAKTLSLKSQATNLQNVIARVEFTDANGNLMNEEIGVKNATNILKTSKEHSTSVFMIGNGGSAAVVSHILTDFINVAGLRASTLHESSLITCMANDYGYENVFSTSLDKIAKKDDILIAVSSSGLSMNVVNGVNTMKRLGGKVLTFSGFDKNNTLRQLGDLNVWLGDHQYGRVEIGHLFILHHLADSLEIATTDTKSPRNTVKE